ncbi:MAG TPA: hypothetical protein VHC47_01610 [Mucilaginibacter sp.]|nr:hypothetical protein [Mucilaginibacter sp.]
MNKTIVFRSLLLAALICLMLWDGMLWLTGTDGTLPEQHREILLTGFLVWFASLFLNPGSDDDWAGQF